MHSLRSGELGASVGIVVNLCLAAAKLIVGVVANSKAMLADGLHSLSDVLGSSCVLIGLRIAQVPADATHPYGHGRAETLAAGMVSVFLIGAGLQMGYSSVSALIQRSLNVPGELALWTALISILVKEILYQYKIRLGKRIRSQAVIANAWEHRSDAISSVASFAGILAARSGYSFMDAVAGAAVSSVVVVIGLKLGIQAIDQLMDKNADESVLKRLATVVKGIEGVKELNSLKCRSLGPNILVDVEIGVKANTDLLTSHRIAHEVKEAILKEVDEVSDVFVHVNPEGQHALQPGREN